jgi:hypothetical protein
MTITNFSHKIIPVFLGFSALSKNFSNDDVDYLRRFQPIGCRDQYSMENLRKYNINAYVNGCMTATFPKRRNHSKISKYSKVFFIDVPDDFKKFVPKNILLNSEFSNHVYFSDENGNFIRFGSTHLDAQREPKNRAIQIREINQIAEEEGLPFIIAGDLNAEEQSAEIKHFDQKFTRTCQNCDPTFPVVSPNKTIDFIAFKKGNAFITVKHYVVQEHYASDHLPVVAILKW